MDCKHFDEEGALASTLEAAVAALQVRRQKLHLDKAPLRTLSGSEMQMVGGGLCHGSSPD